MIPGGLFGLCVATVKTCSNDTWWSVGFIYGCYQGLFKEYPVVCMVCV